MPCCGDDGSYQLFLRLGAGTLSLGVGLQRASLHRSDVLAISVFSRTNAILHEVNNDFSQITIECNKCSVVNLDNVGHDTVH